jgi:hypothetical protein
VRIRTTIFAALVASVTLGAAAGCASTSSVQGTPTPSAPVPTSKTLPYAGAPAVTKPLDTKSIDADPCPIATGAQIAAIGGFALKNTSPDDGGRSKSCIWNLVDGYGQLSGGTLLDDDQGLSLAYEQHAGGQLTQFRVVAPIDGYPAVVATNAPADGYCPLRVGLRDDMTYLAIADLSPWHPLYKDPCSVATKIADLAIKHLRGA